MIYRLFLILMICPFLVAAQGIKKRIADKKYANYDYPAAIKHYEGILKKRPNDTDSEEKLADSYRQIKDNANTEKWYGKICQRANPRPPAMLYYAQALASSEKYSEAKKWYLKYGQAVVKDSRAASFADFYENKMSSLQKNQNDYTLAAAAFNSPASEFSPSLLGNQVLFCSNRALVSNGVVKEEYKWTKSSYLDLYLADSVGKVSRFNSTLNSQYHEGPAAIFSDGNKMIFSRNNYFQGKSKKNGKGVHKLGMYVSEKQNGVWANLTPFVYNNVEYNVAHPALSADNKTLYFASDMAGGLGQTDLYVCYYENDAWTKPLNLGKGINTEGKEEFPYIDKMGNLFFASDGHGGFGGLDLFFAEKTETAYEPIVNLGMPINSSADDFGIAVEPSGKSGYISSNRSGRGMLDDIYSFSGKPFGNLILVAASVSNAQTGQALGGAELKFSESQTQKSIFSGDQGQAVTKLNKTKTYEVTVQKPGFDPKTIQLSPENMANYGQNSPLAISLTQIIEYVPTVSIVDQKTREPVLAHLVVVKKGVKTPIIDKEDISNLALDGLTNGAYELRASAKGYFYNNDTLMLNTRRKTDKVLTLKKLITRAVLVIHNINFEFNSDQITPEGLEQAASLTQLMKENPSLKIGIYAHSDAVGSDADNLSLSSRRAKSVQKLLLSESISASRMVSKGFGEKKPIATNNTPEGRAENRRVEFEVMAVKGIDIKGTFNAKKKANKEKFNEKKAIKQERQK